MAIKSIKQAVILAGGLGTRLRPFTNDLPKPMVAVNGIPFVEHMLRQLRALGFTEIVFLLGYLPEKVTSYFGDGSRFGLSIRHSLGAIEDESGTRLRNARDMLDEHFLLMYSDNHWPIRLDEMLASYNEGDALALMTAYRNRDGGGEYGFENNVYADEAGMMRAYDQTRKDPRLNGVEIGFFIVNKKVTDDFPPHNFSFQGEIIPQLIKKGAVRAYMTDHPYYPLTSPAHIQTAGKFLMSKKVIFLDRDGVINKKPAEHDYVKSREEFEFLPEAVPALSLLAKKGYKLFIVTNQRGIARGLMTEADLAGIHEKMQKKLGENGIHIEAMYYCPHGSEDPCACRKPKPGMFFKAARDHSLNLHECIFIGDGETDRQAGEAAGCKTFIIHSGKEFLKLAEQIS